MAYYFQICIHFNRGQDVSSFHPPPDAIITADVVYYEEVSERWRVLVSSPGYPASIGGKPRDKANSIITVAIGTCSPLVIL